MIHLIVCMGQNREIGKDNDMPWGRGLPADLQYFQQVTSGKEVIMGRKTFDSIITSLGRPLPDRHNIVLTRDKEFQYDEITTIHSIEEVLKKNIERPEQDLFVIGGASIYQRFIDAADSLYITRINQSFEADTYFPAFNEDEWEEISKKQGIKNEKNPYDYEFIILKKK